MYLHYRVQLILHVTGFIYTAFVIFISWFDIIANISFSCHGLQRTLRCTSDDFIGLVSQVPLTAGCSGKLFW